ncbi:hypothetical protein MMC31_004599 [Peltigera leucophlebia]|nr:hypothetical protein [Peltigera leucophlebia]
MSDYELGIDTIINKDKLGKYVLLNKNKEAGRERVCLEDEPIFTREEVMANGTTACYCAKRSNSKQWEFVVKFVWRLETDRPEEKLLALTKQRNVWGVVQLWNNQDIESIANLRRALGYNATDGTPDNRIFSCVIIAPYGRTLWQFTTTNELLMVFRDATRAHKSLYQDGKILHQDISIENIIFTETDNEEDPRGMLIDFDQAMELDVGPKSDSELIGTKPFMAIGILLLAYMPSRSRVFPLCFFVDCNLRSQKIFPKDEQVAKVVQRKLE